MSLHHLLIESAQRLPERAAVRHGDDVMSYGELDQLANRMARALADLGVGRGDRVAVWLEKSPLAVAATQAVLRLGAAYLPVDPLSPASRARVIIEDCDARCVVTTEKRAREQDDRRALVVDTDSFAGGAGRGDVDACSGERLPDPGVGEDDLAYVLYTSGSTGRPKGVCLSHRNALAFIGWAREALQATAEDRFSNHAPFHFDLSVLDLYVPFSVGASVSPIPASMAYVPETLVELIRRHELTVWYSVPSALALLLDAGGLAERPPETLRAVCFAGEPFPVPQLARLQRALAGARLLNLYGPTETNVCTYFEVTEPLEEHSRPIPIGRACSGDRAWAVTAAGEVAGPGGEGELMVEGPTVMLGYWGRPPQAGAPYATGDIVRVADDGVNFEFIGRRDHMVKVRGHRIELGEIEAALIEHPAIREAAVVVDGSGLDARLVGFVCFVAGESASVVDLRLHCGRRLPRYMIIDGVRVLESLPRTRNGKVDRVRLQQMARRGEMP